MRPSLETRNVQHMGNNATDVRPWAILQGGAKRGLVMTRMRTMPVRMTIAKQIMWAYLEPMLFLLRDRARGGTVRPRRLENGILPLLSKVGN